MALCRITLGRRWVVDAGHTRASETLFQATLEAFPHLTVT